MYLMNKKFVLLMSLIFLVGLAVFVSAVFRPSYDENNDNKVVYDIQKAGWYMIPLGLNLDGCQRIMINQTNWINTLYVKAWWVWSPTLNKYIGGKDFNKFEGSQVDLQQFQSDKDNNYLYATEIGGGIWVYIAGKCKLDAYIHDASFNDSNLRELFSQFKLAKGWNFMAIVPPYIGNSFNELKGNCNVIKVAEWDANIQKFNVPSNLNDALNIKWRIEDVGGVVLVKVAETCNLGLSSLNSVPPSQPPTIPN